MRKIFLIECWNLNQSAFVERKRNNHNEAKKMLVEGEGKDEMRDANSF